MLGPLKVCHVAVRQVGDKRAVRETPAQIIHGCGSEGDGGAGGAGRGGGFWRRVGVLRVQLMAAELSQQTPSSAEHPQSSPSPAVTWRPPSTNAVDALPLSSAFPTPPPFSSASQALLNRCIFLFFFYKKGFPLSAVSTHERRIISVRPSFLLDGARRPCQCEKQP